ncbi:MAG: DUF4159 domain-containing protein [Planctomycetota bacterium]
MPPIRRLLLALCLAVLPSFSLAQEQLDPAAVLGAIDRGVSFLKSEQQPNGRWNDAATLDGGATGLATLALLNCGLDAKDPSIAKALEALAKLSLNHTYTVALQTMALAEGGPDKYRLKVQQNVDYLEENQTRAGNRSGAWSYFKRGGGDPSNTQFALLALYEAQRIGVRVDPEVWRRSNSYWRRTQNRDGSWDYPGSSIGNSGSMTCAGIGALSIIAKALEEGDARVVDGRVRCCVQRQEDEAIDRALAWLGRNFSVRRNPAAGLGDTHWKHYYLYGLERAGRLTAQRFIGDHDWYREGTAELVQSQDQLSGHWQGFGSSEGNRQICTSFALLFMSKGRRPVLMAKATHGPEDADERTWNAHRHDADHLTRRAEQAWGLDLTWQLVKPEAASVEDLMQSPVLYISGAKATQLAPLGEKLRQYVDRGGFIFAESPCGSGLSFRRHMEKLVEAMFPEPEYRLRQLRPAHPLWRMERLVRPESPYVGSLWAVEYGCRTCMVFCDRDLSCYWELDNPQRNTSYPADVKKRIGDATAIGLNVLAYATNREPRGKEQALVDAFEAGQEDAENPRGVIQIAKLRHGGGCDDAPGALANLARAAARGEVNARLVAAPELVGIGDKAFFRHHLYFMHGRHDFRLTPAERGKLRDYLIERDGTLLVDSICASEAFTRAFRRELLASLSTGPGPAPKLEQVPADDPIFTTEFGGYDVRKVTLRDPQPGAEDQPIAARSRQVAPRLEGVRVNGRWRVLFSPFDLSCALERHEAVECRGYSRQDAARIALNVLLYSINQ